MFWVVRYPNISLIDEPTLRLIYQILWRMIMTPAALLRKRGAEICRVSINSNKLFTTPTPLVHMLRCQQLKHNIVSHSSENPLYLCSTTVKYDSTQLREEYFEKWQKIISRFMEAWLWADDKYDDSCGEEREKGHCGVCWSGLDSFEQQQQIYVNQLVLLNRD